MSERWSTLLDELIDPAMRDEWGWTVPRSVRGTEQPLQADTLVELDCGGLSVPYFCGWIAVDFGAGTVAFIGVDQKTPADMRWDPTPSADWWARARACAWPQPIVNRA